MDKSNPNLSSQQYEIYTAEMVYALDKSKFNIIYNHVTIDDFIYYTPIGFINVDRPIKTEGITLNFTHNFTPSNTLYLNYFASKQSEGASNYQNGGYVKYMASHGKLDYFTSLIYKKFFTFYDVNVKDCFDLSLGATYNFTKDFSLSIKALNLLEKSTQSIYTQGFPGAPFALENEPERSINLSIRWVF